MEALVQRIKKLEQAVEQLAAGNHHVCCRLSAVEAAIPGLCDPTNDGDVLVNSGRVTGALRDQKLAWIPLDVSSVGPRAFHGNGNLMQVVLPELGVLTAVESEAFQGCKQLMRVRVPSSVVQIDDWAFGESGLVSVEFSPKSRLERLGVGAFSGTNLGEILIPASVRVIGAEAFYACQKLGKVDFEAGSKLRDLGNYAFQEIGVTSFAFPPGVTAIPEGALAGCGSLGVVSISGGDLRSIGDDAFWACKNLKSICQVGDADSPANNRLQLAGTNLRSIGFRAFRGCMGLREAVFPPSLASIGDFVFCDCTGLTKVAFAGAALRQIPGDAFRGCSGLREVVLPSSVKHIQGGTFGSAALTMI